MGILLAISISLVALGALGAAFANMGRGVKEIRDVFLPQKFAELGNMTGKTKAEIIMAVGEPTHISYMSGDLSLLQWITKRYHIGLLFKGEVFLKVNNESVFKG